MTETALREHLCLPAKSLYDRGLPHGSTGNITARLPSGGVLVWATSASFGRLDPARLSRFYAQGSLTNGTRRPRKCPCIARFTTPAAPLAQWYTCIRPIRWRCR